MAKEMRGGPGSARKMRPVEMNAPKSASDRAAEKSRPKGSKSPRQREKEALVRPEVKKFLSVLDKEAQKAGAVGSVAYKKRLADLSSAMKLAASSKGQSFMPVTKSLQLQTRSFVPGKVNKGREAVKKEAMANIDKMRKSGK